MHLALDLRSGLADALADLGCTVVDDETQLRRADVVALGADWERLAGWRLGGVVTPAVVVADGPPEDRIRFEPVAVVQGPEQLAAALDALRAGQQARRIDLGDVVVDLPRRRLVHGDGREVRLSQREAELLGYLGARSGREVERDELLTQVWGHRKPGPSRTVDMAVYRLRRKLEPDPATPRFLVSSYAGGYRLLVPTRSTPPAPSSHAGLPGRDALVRQLRHTLDEHGRVTLVGPPGVGKTALARALDPSAPVVDAADVRHLPDLLTTLAVRLDVATPVIGALADTAAAVARALGDQLVVLDDADDLDDDAMAWLEGRRVLLTRQRPGGPAPWLAVPPLAAESARELLAARLAEHGVSVPDDALTALVEACDGLPLALELVAQRLRLLPAEVLLDRVDALPRLLRTGTTGTRRDGLGPALAWGWSRLDDPHRALLVAVSVFPGAVPLDAVDEVGGPDALVDLDALVAAGWVRVRHGAVELLRPVRAYVREVGEGLDDARARHDRWVLGQAIRLLEALGSASARAALEEAAPHRSAMVEALGRAVGVEAAPLALAIDGIDGRHGPLDARIERLRATVARLGDAPEALDVRLALERLLSYRDLPHAHERLLPLAHDARRLGREGLAYRAASLAASFHRWTGGVESAQALQAPFLPPDDDGRPDAVVARARWIALEAYRGQRTPIDAGASIAGSFERLTRDGHVHDAVRVGRLATFWIDQGGDPGWAQRIHDRLCGMAEATGDGRLEYIVQAQRAFCQRARHDFEGALASIDQAVEIAAQREPARVASFQMYRGSLLLHLQHFPEARAAFEHTIDRTRSLGHRVEAATACMGLAAVAAEQGDLDEALRVVQLGRDLADAAGAHATRDMLDSQLGIVLHLRGDPAGARAAYERLEGHALVPGLEAEWLARRWALGGDDAPACWERLQHLGGLRDIDATVAAVAALREGREPVTPTSDVRLLVRAAQGAAGPP